MSHLPKLFLSSDSSAHLHAHFLQITIWVSCRSEAYQTSVARADEAISEGDNTLEQRSASLCDQKHTPDFCFLVNFLGNFLYFCSEHNNMR